MSCEISTIKLESPSLKILCHPDIWIGDTGASCHSTAHLSGCINKCVAGSSSKGSLVAFPRYPLPITLFRAKRKYFGEFSGNSRLKCAITRRVIYLSGSADNPFYQVRGKNKNYPNCGKLGYHSGNSRAQNTSSTTLAPATLLQLPLSVVTIIPALVAVHKVVVCGVKLLMFSVFRLGSH
jgi:hypothetical protein